MGFFFKLRRLIVLVVNKSYLDNLKKGMNPYRRYEYAINSFKMLVIIATFVGVWDLWSLVMIFVLNAVMIFGGLLMEKINFYTKKTDCSVYLRVLSGFVPWVVIAAYFVPVLSSSDANPPRFVYYIVNLFHHGFLLKIKNR